MSTEHQPAPHADRDGSERLARMEREHERGLAADVAEPSSILTFEQKLSEADVATIRSLFAKAERLRRRVVKAEADVEMWRARYEVADGEAKAAEAALARVEALAESWLRAPGQPPFGEAYAKSLLAELADPEAAG